MTAVIAYLADKEGYLVTDGATHHLRSGARVGIFSKTMVIPHLPAVMVVRGPVAAGYAVYTKVSSYRSIEELRTSIRRDLKKLQPVWVRWLSWKWPYEVNIVALENGKPVGFRIASGHIDGAVIPPFELEEVGPRSYWIGPDAPDEDVEAAKAGWIDRSDWRNIPNAMVQLMEAMRKAEPKVGGFIQYTQIHDAGIHTSIIHKWDEDGR